MTSQRKQELRALTKKERQELEHVSRSWSEPMSRVGRARVLLAVADGFTYEIAAKMAGRRSRHGISPLIERFNRRGLSALNAEHAGGREIVYTPEKRAKIVEEFRRLPDRKKDGTASWTISTLQRSLRSKGLKKVGHETIWRTLHEAGLSWQKDRSWAETGKAMRVRKHETVEVRDPDAEAKKKSH